jgi:hypothetical protein
MAIPSVPVRCAGERSNCRKPGRHTQRLCKKIDPQAAILGTKNCDVPYHKQQAILHIAHHESSTFRFRELRTSSCEQPELLSLIACFHFRLTARLLLNLSLKQLHTTNLYEYS